MPNKKDPHRGSFLFGGRRIGLPSRSSGIRLAIFPVISVRQEPNGEPEIDRLAVPVLHDRPFVDVAVLCLIAGLRGDGTGDT